MIIGDEKNLQQLSPTQGCKKLESDQFKKIYISNVINKHTTFIIYILFAHDIHYCIRISNLRKH